MFKRAIIFSYEEYAFLQYTPLFKVEKCPEHFPQPLMKYAHHPYYIEYKTEEVENEAIGHEAAFDSTLKFSDSKRVSVPSKILQNQNDALILKDLLCLINTLSNSYFFQYEGIDQSWCMSLGKESKLVYAQKGYEAPDYERNIDEINFCQNTIDFLPLIRFKNEDGTCQRDVNITKLLNAYFSLKCELFKSDFLNACTVFAKAIELSKYDISSSFLLMVSSIEALIAIEYRNQKVDPCKRCKQKHYAVTEKFRNFIDKYGYQVDKKTKNEFYSLRSDIAHLGKMMRESYSSHAFITSDEQLENAKKLVKEKEVFDNFKKLAQICFRVFLFKNQ